MTSKPSRREFLQSSAAAAFAAPLATRRGATTRSATRRDPLKLLILGGTGFLGPAIVESAVANGHTVTLFNRGKTNPQLFPDLEKLRGNRRRPTSDRHPPQDLEALRGRDWDAVIDTSGYYTANVEDMAALLADHVQQYLYVSSISVYRDLGKSSDPIDETSTLAECEDKYVASMGQNYEFYGALKAYCEQAVEAALPGRATLVRPGYIVGPRDFSDRFTYWPIRFARGGEILAPGPRDAMQQFVDVRDLGEWIVRCCEQRTMGAFNAVGFKGHISTEELMHTGKGTLNHESSFTWVDSDFLRDHDVSSWGEMSCWCHPEAFNVSRNEKAIEAGLRFRPIAETIRDTYEWASEARAAMRELRPDWKPRAGMSEERERELLAAWKAR